MVFDELFQYGLQNAFLSRISRNSDKNCFILEFNDGIYELNENIKETKITSKCTMTINIKSTDKAKESYNIHRWFAKYNIISVGKLNALAKKYKIMIIDVFYSMFDNDTIYFKAKYNNVALEIQLYNCESIEYSFEKI